MDKRHTSAVVKLAGANANAVDFTISDSDSDRVKDTINVHGWDTVNFLKNPVVLWGHESWDLPIGKASNLRVEGQSLMATAEFAVNEYPLADTVLKLLKGQYLNAVSVGFKPIEWTYNDHGIDFIKQELLEFSVVSIPANPNALAVARSKGIATQALMPGLMRMHHAAKSDVERGHVKASIFAATGEYTLPNIAAIVARDNSNFRRKTEIHARQLRLRA
jgi:HK97 family phage prohead protease